MEVPFAPKDVVDAERYRSHFDRTVKLFGLRIPRKKAAEISKALVKHKYKRSGVRPMQPDPQKEESWGVWVLPEEWQSLEDVPEDIRAWEGRIEGSSWAHVEVSLSHKNYSQAEVLQELLPKGMVVPLSFETVGHIAHLNLRDDHHPYRFLIGRVVLDKNPGLRTVVNKLGTIDSEFREFKLEVLAGDHDMNAKITQHKCVFHVPYDKVYWNSRLQTEHERLVQLLKKGDVLCDVMAGVGPFAIPAAKRGHRVFANDLNPASHASLVRNAKENKVEALVEASCEDGRAFVARMRDKLLKDGSKELPAGATVHFSMNLPATAVEFLDAFRDEAGWAAEGIAAERAVVHVYCFSRATDFKAEAITQAEKVIGHPLPGAVAHHVRNVAPRKEMVCVTFRVRPGGEGEEGAAKRRRAEADPAAPV
eukprot:Hpha_TRINITY_DN35190_c0_g1::TRINITY_DN35190_c0_g1_i1::g.168512::m.168512/K15429/TRM5, TRMT5; tRNA (guanine37-N1)-methyltransferase